MLGEDAVGDDSGDVVEAALPLRRHVQAQVVRVDDDVAMLGFYAAAVFGGGAQSHQLAPDLAARHRYYFYWYRESAERSNLLRGDALLAVAPLAAECQPVREFADFFLSPSKRGVIRGQPRRVRSQEGEGEEL